MATLYLIEQGAMLHCDGKRLEVRREGEVIGSAPLVKIHDIVVFGNIGLSTPAIKRLLERNIDVVFLTLDGHYHGRLVGEMSAHVALRQAQYARTGDAERSLRQARQIVEGKLRNQRAVLQRFNRNRASAPDELTTIIDETERNLRRVSRTTRLHALLGLEGSATARYFSGVRALIGPEWRFNSRQRRPPPDPVNVLLSLGYTLLAHKALGAVQAAGFDPYLGILHQYAYKHPSLALDLMEEFRPILVDSLVIRLCNDGRITLDDFTPGDEARPVVLSDDGMRRFLAAFEERMRTEATHPEGSDSGPGKVSYLRCLELQARRLARVVRGETDLYEPFSAR